MKKKLYEVNTSASLYVPSNPALNEALQSTQIDGMQYTNVTIEQMRDSPELFNTRLSGYDKISDVQRVQRELMPKVNEYATKMQQLKQQSDLQTGRFRK